MLTFWGKLAVCLACLIAVLSLPTLGMSLVALVKNANAMDPLWWLGWALWVTVTGVALALWRAMWVYLDWRR